MSKKMTRWEEAWKELEKSVSRFPSDIKKKELISLMEQLKSDNTDLVMPQKKSALQSSTVTKKTALDKIVLPPSKKIAKETPITQRQVPEVKQVPKRTRKIKKKNIAEKLFERIGLM